nr:neutral zinc metallopeptidase [Nodosilinea sp. LEGE 07298]
MRLVLQADCFAEVWAHNAQVSRQTLEEGDIEESLNAASRIGGDRLQLEAQGYVTPDSFNPRIVAAAGRMVLSWD